jgi:O-6-methylguanine DNA methyltransferase
MTTTTSPTSSATLGATGPEAAALASLAVSAPPTLRASVLVEVGLVDRYGRVDSPLGPLVVAWNGIGVVSVDIAGDDGAFEASHLASTGRRAIPSEMPPRLANAIARRLQGERRVRIPLDLRAHSAFEQDVWRKALDIPRGEVRPYGWVAAEIGRPKAVRAVGTALGHNPVPLIVPCHRVVRSDGTIGQYSLGGPENKRTILSAEGLDPDAMEDAARRGERLVGSASTRIVCWPTCRTGKHLLERNRRPFRSLAEAGAAGYRPCKVCRPVSAAA